MIIVMRSFDILIMSLGLESPGLQLIIPRYIVFLSDLKLIIARENALKPCVRQVISLFGDWI